MKISLLLSCFLIFTIQNLFSQPFFKVKIDNKKAIINKQGTVKFEYSYDSLVFANPYFYCIKDNNVGLIDTCGNVLIPVKYKDIKFDISNHLSKIFPVKTSDSFWTFYKFSEGGSSFAKYDNASTFVNNVAMVFKDNEYILIDTNGIDIKKSTIPFNDYSFDVESEIYIPMTDDGFTPPLKKRRGKYGWRNSEKKWIIPPKYESLEKRNRCWIAQQNGKFGIISSSGDDVILDCKYDKLEYDDFFKLGYYVYESGKVGYFLLGSKLLIEPKYNYISVFK